MKIWRAFLTYMEGADQRKWGILIGIAMGVLYLIVGFWKVIMFSIFVAIGYGIGRILETKEDWRDVIERIWPNNRRD